MRICVTGGAGFIGSHVVDACIENGHEVVVVDNLTKGKKSNIHPQATFYEMDVRSADIQALFAQYHFHVVIHHAAQSAVTPSIEDPLQDGQTNIMGTIQLLEASRKSGVQKFIYASSAAVYGEPQYMGIDEDHPIQPRSPYGISKYVGELYIRNYGELYGLPYTIFRYANIYGERQDPDGEGGVISIFTDRAIQGKELVIYGDGEQTRDFIYVKDVVTANLLALQQGAGDFQTFNVSTHLPTSLLQLVDTLSQVMDKPLTVVHDQPRTGDIMHSYLNNERILQQLNWKPQYSLADGLREMIRAMNP